MTSKTRVDLLPYLSIAGVYSSLAINHIIQAIHTSEIPPKKVHAILILKKNKRLAYFTTVCKIDSTVYMKTSNT